MIISHMISPEIDEVRLNDYERQQLNDATEDVFVELSDLPEVEAIEFAYNVGQQLVSDYDPRMHQLAEFFAKQHDNTESRAYIIDGLVLPEDYIPPTPNNYLTAEEFELLKPQARRLIVLGMMGVYGYGYSERQQPGTVHNEVIAIKEHFDTPAISANPTQELGLHIEDTYLNTQHVDGAPDWLTIFMKRNPDKVPTTISFPNIDQIRELEKVLWQDVFLVTTNASNYNPNDTEFRESILYGPTDKPFYRVNLANFDMDAHTPEQQEAVRLLAAHADRKKTEVCLEPGEMLVVNNRSVMHGRALYQPHQMPKWDGNDRYQSRIIAANEAARMQQFEDAPRLVSPSKVLKAAVEAEKNRQ